MRIFIILLFLFHSLSSLAQVGGNNLMEFQAGNLPEDSARDFTTHYNRLNLSYHQKNLTLFAQYETFLTPIKERNYQQLTRYGLNYREKGWEFTLGNYYETLGRGSLLRTYEIPGFILEDRGYRTRQSFFRDLQGISVRYSGRIFSIRMQRGKVLNNVYPPTSDYNLRRTDLLESVFSSLRWKKQIMGIGILRNQKESESLIYPLITYQGSLFKNVSYYLEYTQFVNSSNPFLDLNPELSKAFYASLNYTFNSFGFSAEYKDYHNYILGTGYNEPPALIKEHSYKLLNRSSHIPVPIDESGYQFDFYWNGNGGQILSLNHSMATNLFITKYIYKEFFAEYYTPFNDKHAVKFFADYSQDPFNAEPNRYAGGSYANILLKNRWSIEQGLEIQQISRNGDEFLNSLITTSISKSSVFSAGYLLEISQDPNLLKTGRKTIFFPAINIRYKPTSVNTLQLFAGKRRGGPACTSGVCYEVLDFNGIELRWNLVF